MMPSGYLARLSSEHLPSKLWLVVPREEDIPTLMESLQFWIPKHRNILYYPADDSDSLDGISPARTIPQRRLLTLSNGTVASHVWFYRLLLERCMKAFLQKTLSTSVSRLNIEEEYDIPITIRNISKHGVLKSMRIR